MWNTGLLGQDPDDPAAAVEEPAAPLLNEEKSPLVRELYAAPGNAGIAQVRSEWTWILDDDDLPWLPDPGRREGELRRRDGLERPQELEPVGDAGRRARGGIVVCVDRRIG